jgi:hypothetical protein
MKIAVIVLIAGVVMFVPLQILLPFPFGIGIGLSIIIIGIVTTLNSTKTKKIEKDSKINQAKRKFCTKCGTKLSENSKFCSVWKCTRVTQKRTLEINRITSKII